MPTNSPKARSAARLALLALVGAAGCFSMVRDPTRHFYVLHVAAQAPSPQASSARLPDSLVRVRDLDCESAYDKFQMVVRSSPYELLYRQKDVWAVKPGRMVSDVVARALQQRGLFAGVTRELGERRPDWLVSGDLHVFEIEEMTSAWQAHISHTLQVSNVESGDIIWSGHFEEREPCQTDTYRAAAEAMSRAVGRSVERAILSLEANPPRATPEPAAAP